jgi:hypothetical protein
MSPNFPSQIAQRWAAPLQTYWGLPRIFASFGPLRLAARLKDAAGGSIIHG